MRRRPPGPAWRRGALGGQAAAVVVAVLAGCTASSDPPAATTSSSAPTSPAADSTPAAESTAAPAAVFPDNCGVLLPVTDLDAALGVGLPGSVSYVRGEPLPGIGRTDRITCGYGIVIGPDGKAQPPLLEVSISSYTDDAAAAGRIDVTTADRQSAGDRVENTEAGGRPAVLLTGVTGTTLVLADGAWTYSLTLLMAVLPPEQTPAGLVGVAEAILERNTSPNG